MNLSILATYQEVHNHTNQDILLQVLQVVPIMLLLEVVNLQTLMLLQTKGMHYFVSSIYMKEEETVF